MSTKTSIKRIAAVAAVALTLGGFSAVSANAAAVATATLQATAGYSNASAPSASVAATANAVADGNHYVTVKLLASTADKGYTVSATGVGSIYGSATGTAVTDSAVTVTNNNGANAAGGFAFGPGSSFPSASAFGGAGYVTFTVVSSAAGSQTITATPINGTSAASTLTITWGVAPALSVANSKIATLAWDTDAATTATAFSNYLKDATVVSTSAASTTPAAVVRVIIKNDEATPAAISGDTISASIISGPGLLTTTASAVGDTYTVTAVNGTPSTVVTRTTGAAGAAFFHVLPSGSSGVATIQFKDGTTVLGTATVTFFGTTPSTLAVSAQNYNIATAGTALGASDATAGSGAVTLVAKDVNGYTVGGLGTTVGTATGNWTAKSDNTACIVSTPALVAAGTSASTSDGVGYYNVDVTAAAGAASGCVANVTFKYVVSSTVTLETAPVKFTVGGTTIYGITLKAANDSYAPGEKVVLTLAATDVSGNPIADGSYGVFFDHATSAAFAGLTTSASTTSAPFALAAVTSPATNSISFTNGVATSTIYAPYTDGTVNVSGTLAKSTVSNSDLATALKGTALTGSFTVVTGSAASAQAAIDAAQEATDAANAAYDAANNAMDSADAATAAAQDASDNASAALAAVTSLSATVAKLVKSVAAIAAALAKVQKKIGA